MDERTIGSERWKASGETTKLLDLAISRQAEGTRDPEWMIEQARRFIDAEAYMIESEGMTENADTWRDPDRWEEFRERHSAELEEAGKMGDLRDIAQRASEENVTLLFGAKDTKHNNARALQTLVEKAQHQFRTRQSPEGRDGKRA